MPPFEGPSPIQNWSLYCEWSQNVGPEMRSPELLWVKYWERFNTVKIPILPVHTFFETALEVAKLSKNKEEFEQRFEEVNSKRKEDILKLMWKAYTDTRFDCEVRERGCLDALRKARYACSTGSLEDFLQVTKGAIYGWEAEEIFDNTPKPCKDCGSTQLLSCLMCNSKLDFCSDCGQAERGCSNCISQYADINPAYLYRTYAQERAFEERQDYLGRVIRDAEEVDDEQQQLNHGPSSCISCGSTRLLSCKLCESKVDFCGECGKQPDGCLSCSTQYLNDDSNDGTFRAVNLFPFSTEHNRALEEDSSSKEESIPRKRSDADNATSSLTEEPQTFYQRDSMSPDYDDYVDAVEYQEPTSTSTATGIIINAPAGILVKANKGQATPRKQKRVSFSNVDDIRHYQKELQPNSSNFASTQQVTRNETQTRRYGRLRKRTKLTTSTFKPTFINLASPLAGGQNAFKKRSRYNDANADADADANNHTQKRPKYMDTSFHGLDQLNALVAAESASGSSSPESELVSANPPTSHDASKKRSRYDNDDDADTNNHAQKRQKYTDYSFYGLDELNALIALDAAQSASGSSSPEAESVNPPSPPAASHDASSKRSRYDDDDDHDDVDSHTQKRQKTETSATYSPISRASSPTHQDAKINEGTRERPQNLETSHSPPRPVNTRSLRTQRQPEFWELDGLGQPRSL